MFSKTVRYKKFKLGVTRTMKLPAVVRKGITSKCSMGIQSKNYLQTVKVFKRFGKLWVRPCKKNFQILGVSPKPDRKCGLFQIFATPYIFKSKLVNVTVDKHRHCVHLFFFE